MLEGGWLHTGDVAVLDPDGHLRIVDRKKAIFVTSGGKNVSPSLVENALKVSPYIKEAVVLGEGEKFVSALVQIDFENVGQWATERKLAYTNFRSLTLLPEVRELVDAGGRPGQPGARARWSRSASSGSSRRSWTTTTTRSPPP